jgi:hypothetical protein
MILPKNNLESPLKKTLRKKKKMSTMSKKLSILKRPIGEPTTSKSCVKLKKMKKKIHQLPF